MDSLIELIIAVIVIVASAFWDKGKGKGNSQTGDSSDDLAAIEEFFNKQASKDPFKQESQNASVAGGWESAESASFNERQNELPAPTREWSPPVEPSRPKPKPKKAKKQERPRQGMNAALIPASHQESEGECLDDGRVNYEKNMPKIPSAKHETPAARPRARWKWGRKQLLDAFVMSQLMTRYDITRMYERIPGRRSQ